MAGKRTTLILTPEDVRLLREASKREGLSQSALIRKGIRTVTSAYRTRPKRLVGWLKLSKAEQAEIEDEGFGDPDA